MKNSNDNIITSTPTKNQSFPKTKTQIQSQKKFPIDHIHQTHKMRKRESVRWAKNAENQRGSGRRSHGRGLCGAGEEMEANKGFRLVDKRKRERERMME